MFSLIVAIAKNRVIGKDNKLLWHISDDLKRFKKLTSHKKMIMGRKTFQSLPGILPNRDHIILTHNRDFVVDSPNVSIFHDADTLLKQYKDCSEEIFIIGGAEIYKQFLPYCKNLYITKIQEDFKGDTFFPEIDYEIFEVESSSQNFIDEKSGFSYQYVNLTHK